jgi:predicted SprT family Zn-dependent metalloprotease
MSDELRSLITKWGALWGVPDLESGISVTFSGRLKKSLGRCRPSLGRITLRSDLQNENSSRLVEVLCHEAAHVAAYKLFGSAAAPHGPEWRSLVTQAGFEPHVRTAGPSAEQRAPSEGPPTLAYEHRCPVCHTVRYARRPVSRWRCAECLDTGLPGELVITRHRPESRQ